MEPEPKINNFGSPTLLIKNTSWQLKEISILSVNISKVAMAGGGGRREEHHAGLRHAHGLQ